MEETLSFPQSGLARHPRVAWLTAIREHPLFSWAPFLGVVGVALFLNVWKLSEAGYGNTYYAAAVRSMTESWKNFFFGALDPGGFITVDKPPVFLWIGALSARIFGYSSWSLLLPSAIAGAATVGLVWLIVRRHFGVGAATIAGLVLAFTPISVAVDRLNLPEPFLILALVAAAACILQSFESRHWLAWVVAAGVLVGVAFNIKMLAGWIPGPALALAIVAGVAGPRRAVWRQWLLRLAVLGIVTVASSASWMLVVDAWPASDRPYVGGSTNNTVRDLALGYNGLDRVDGEDQGPPNGGRGQQQRAAAANPGATPPGAPTLRDGQNGFPGQAGAGQNGFPGGPGAPAGPGGLRGPGGIIAGKPGLFRMFDAANGSQIAWFLPFALIGGLLALWHWRGDPVRRGASVLWLGWVLLFGGVFSYTQGIYHSYYTAALAPGIAVMVGIGFVAVAELAKRNAAWLAGVIALAAATVFVQMHVSGMFPGFFEWVRPVTVTVALVGVALAVFALARRLPLRVGLAVVIGALLLLPAAWATHETVNASLNTTLPQAGPRQGAAGRTFGSNAFDNGTTALAAWLRAHGDANARWDLAVESAQTASRLIAADDLSVMSIGGFSGRDPTIAARDFADYVEKGEIRYVLVVSGFGGPPGGGLGSFRRPGAAPGGLPADLSNLTPQTQGAAAAVVGARAVFFAVQSVCTKVSDSSIPARFSNGLYDCAGKAAALRTR